MYKASFLFLFFLFTKPFFLSAQCLTALPPPACDGTEPLLTDNETLNTGNTKWYYGATVMMNSLTLNGGTLVVCGDLSITQFYMNSGTIYVRPGARLVITSGIGAGLVLRGNSYIYNYGTCEIQRNLSLDNGATSVNPNLVINATPSSVFKMSNQYFVINNPYSWFVNNGNAEFWGIITDPQAATGSVCMGNGSNTRMAVLINKVIDTYTVPSGNACLQVYQFSQFYNRLTNSSGLYACLGASHSSDASCIPWGCQPNNWGAAQVFSNCNNCNGFFVLPVQFKSFNTVATVDGNKLNWQLAAAAPVGIFVVKRSANGVNYHIIDSVTGGNSNATSFSFIDKTPLPGNNYYMITYIDPTTGRTFYSKAAKIQNRSHSQITVHPIPFDNIFFITYAAGMCPEKIILTDMAGRNISITKSRLDTANQLKISVLDHIESGVYIIHMMTKTNHFAQTIFKQ
ncbi:T9SS type A sorting domain-containing protein [Terrimonas pollutisoli]|uniref:T9SS type A sorting domain-containing protein n=1 Tax=Terrimonas pollutisoli TaxID=3034147 RepID=UPI0023EC7CAB|nr:T9SS type A sorting domain-containing protein [Terrimonas sp. H1YJ31]